MDKSIKRAMRLGENSLRDYFGKIEGIDVNAPKQFANEHCGLVLRLEIRGLIRSSISGFWESFKNFVADTQAANVNLPIFTVDVSVKDDLSTLVQSLLYSLEPGLAE